MQVLQKQTHGHNTSTITYQLPGNHRGLILHGQATTRTTPSYLVINPGPINFVGWPNRNICLPQPNCSCTTDPAPAFPNKTKLLFPFSCPSLLFPCRRLSSFVLWTCPPSASPRSSLFLLFAPPLFPLSPSLRFVLLIAPLRWSARPLPVCGLWLCCFFVIFAALPAVCLPAICCFLPALPFCLCLRFWLPLPLPFVFQPCCHYLPGLLNLLSPSMLTFSIQARLISHFESNRLPTSSPAPKPWQRGIWHRAYTTRSTHDANGQTRSSILGPKGTQAALA